MLLDFNLTVSNLTLISLPETHLQIQAAHRKEVVICFFYGAPCTYHFYSVKGFKSFLVRSICGEQSLSFLILVFHHLCYSDFKTLCLAMLEISEVHSEPC